MLKVSTIRMRMRGRLKFLQITAGTWFDVKYCKQGFR